MCLGCFQSKAQFSPAAGKPGSDAIYKDSSIFQFWCDSIILQKGFMQINDTFIGRVSVGEAGAAYGKALENGIVSLGDGGVATAYFKGGIQNGAGPDFAVFENGFAVIGEESFHMELAFVEVSVDGKKFYRFPAQSLNDTLNQADNFTGLFPEKVKNLAGKYISGYGVPFDLQELADSIANEPIHYIRLIDVVGSLNDSFASRDILGRKINDPFPTPFPSSGFDLDAIGVIHGINSNSIHEFSKHAFVVYPNPKSIDEFIHIKNFDEDDLVIECFNSNGQLLKQIRSNESIISFSTENNSSLILLKISSSKGSLTYKIQQW